MRFEDFKKEGAFSIADFCRDFYRANPDSIQVKKEAVAIKNLTTIILTTLKLSNEKGFHSMSLRDLSKASGLSMGALYLYFSSKDDILRIIQHYGHLAVGNILVKYVHQEGDPWMKLCGFIRVHLFLSELMKQWFYFFFMETKHLAKEYRKIPIKSELATEKICVDILNAGIRTGQFNAVDPGLTGAAVKALLQDWYLKPWKYKQRRITVDKYAQHVIGLVESYVTKQGASNDNDR